MSLALLNYIENVKLRLEIEHNRAYIEFIFNHPLRFILVISCWPLRKLRSRFRAFKQIRRIKSLVKSNEPSLETLPDDFYKLRIIDKTCNSLRIQTPYYFGGSEVSEIEERVAIPSNNKKLVIIHAYYESEFDIILAKLKKFKGYDFVLTSNNENLCRRFAETFSSTYTANFLVPNLGRDVFPFLLLVKVLDYSKYTHFVKIHTKRSQHLNDGGRWFKHNVNILIGSRAFTDEVMECISPEKPSIYGVETLPLNDHLENNHKWLNHLMQGTIKNISAKFIPGTMFVGTKVFLDVLESHNLHLHKLEDEAGQLDGCLVHAVERYMGYIASSHGGYCNTLEELALNGE